MNWAIVLAAGEGSRLKGMTKDRNGTPVPKQFCSLTGGASLLEQTVARASSMVPPDRVVTIVAAQHRAWWEPLLRLRAENVIVQPRNRGTAVGMLLPLIEILMRDPDAKVVILPSDHYIRQEDVVAGAVRDSFTRLQTAPQDMVMLGVTPSRPDAELGYITQRSVNGRFRPVDTIIEKPEVDIARELIAAGALWSTFITVARADALAGLIDRCVPGLARSMRECLESADRDRALAKLYSRLRSVDFSRDVLDTTTDRLWVVALPNCGWSDLGTPSRVLACLERLNGDERFAGGDRVVEGRREPRPPTRVWVNLAEAGTQLAARKRGGAAA